MQALIKKIQGEWKAAKDAAQAQCTNNGRYEMAEKLGACDMFKGNETLEELIGMMFSPRGVEFMTTYNFPQPRHFSSFQEISSGAFRRVYRLRQNFAFRGPKNLFDRRHHRRTEIQPNGRKSAISNVRGECLRHRIGVCGRQGRKR